MRGVWIILCMLLLASCQQEPQLNHASSSNTTIEISKQLPALSLIIEGVRTTTVRGAYSWSYQVGNEMVHEMTDIDSPPQIVKDAEAMPFHNDTLIELQFSDEPSRVEFVVWDDKQVVATYEDMQSIQQKDRHVVEIIAYYDDTNSRVSFIKAFDFQ